MKLAVITHRRPGPAKWFNACKESIAIALPQDSRHVIIECATWQQLDQARWDALKLDAEYVCFADDDDLVINDSLRKCLVALEARPNIGVAFTDEQYIDPDGNEIVSLHPHVRHLTYADVSQSAQTVHHLAMIRTSAVNWEAKRVTDHVKAGADWMIKGGTALKSGCVHIPIRGYAWRQRSAQMSKNREWLQTFDPNRYIFRSYLAALGSYKGKIERLD